MLFALPFLAILIGYVIGRYFIEKQQWITYLLSFSGAFLLGVTILELLPQVFATQNQFTGLYILAGLLLQLVLEYFSKGAEHGHVHIHHHKAQFPIVLFLSLSVHALIEGFPVTSNHHVLWGVVLHKIPIAIILAIYFTKAKLKPVFTIIFLFLFALMTPIGSLIAQTTEISIDQLKVINAIAIGVFLHVSTTILFESSKDHKFNFNKLITILLGIVLAYII